MKIKSRAVTIGLRAVVTLGAIALAFSQITVSSVLPMLSDIPLWVFLLALVLIHLTQVAAALRMRFYLRCHSIRFPVKASIHLHYVGELFGAVLPGGAGGDVYKAWWLKRYRQGALLNMAKTMIGARLNGLWALGFLACILILASPLPAGFEHGVLAVSGSLLVGTVGYSLFARFVLREPLRQQGIAMLYSLAIQVGVVLAVWAVCVGLELDHDALAYITLYLFSCVVALLPISIGGIGVRELVLLQGSRMLHLQEESGVALALSLTLISLTVPLVGGLVYLLWKPHANDQ